MAPSFAETQIIEEGSAHVIIRSPTRSGLELDPLVKATFHTTLLVVDQMTGGLASGYRPEPSPRKPAGEAAHDEIANPIMPTTHIDRFMMMVFTPLAYSNPFQKSGVTRHHSASVFNPIVSQ
jgi:hypothetical protein